MSDGRAGGLAEGEGAERRRAPEKRERREGAGSLERKEGALESSLVMLGDRAYGIPSGLAVLAMLARGGERGEVGVVIRAGWRDRGLIRSSRPKRARAESGRYGAGEQDDTRHELLATSTLGRSLLRKSAHLLAFSRARSVTTNPDDSYRSLLPVRDLCARLRTSARYGLPPPKTCTQLQRLSGLMASATQTNGRSERHRCARDFRCTFEARQGHSEADGSAQADTLTAPTASMFEAMVNASRGDDVYGVRCCFVL